MIYINDHYSFTNMINQYVKNNTDIKKQIHEIIIEFNQTCDKSINRFNDKEPL